MTLIDSPAFYIEQIIYYWINIFFVMTRIYEYSTYVYL